MAARFPHRRTLRRGAATTPRLLSIRQPWAWAIASGRKKVENRPWRTEYRGVVYIHAGKTLDRKGLNRLSSKFGVRAPLTFEHGAVIAVAVLSDVVTQDGASPFGPWFVGPYGLVFRNVRGLPRPVRTKGQLGLIRASPSLIRAVNRELARPRPAR